MTPKSTSTGRSSSWRTMLSGLRSPWTMPSPCRNASGWQRRRAIDKERPRSPAPAGGLTMGGAGVASHDAEVHEHRSLVVLEDDVVRLEIAVDDALAV